MSVRSIAMPETPTAYKFTVEDYHRMGEAGILTEDDRVELLRGEVVLMSPIGILHTSSVKRIAEVLQALGHSVTHSVQDPVQLADSEPQPDLALLVRREDFYADRHPGPGDIHLIIEVADSSHVVDREVKAPLYAESGIREYWLVDLPADRIEVYRDPENGAYRTLHTLARGETVAPLAFPDLELRVDDLLP